MYVTVDTHSERLTDDLIKNLRVNFFDNQDIITIIDALDAFEPPLRLKILVLCLILSDETPSIIPGTLRRLQKVSRKLAPQDVEAWISGATELLNSQGTEAFFRFISRTGERHLSAFAQSDRLRFKEVSCMLELYLKGISGSSLAVGTDVESSTDTDTVYFPAVLSCFKRPEDNLLVYLLMAAHKWAQIASGTLTPDLAPVLAGVPLGNGHDRPEDLEALFAALPERELAIDLFTLLEAFMLDSFLWRELPGLMERARSLKAAIFAERPTLDALSEKTAFVEGIYHLYLAGAPKGAAPQALQRLTPRILDLRAAGSAGEIVSVLLACYRAAAALSGPYEPHRPQFFLGTIKPERVARRLRDKRRAMKKKAERMFSTMLSLPKQTLHRSLQPRKALRERPVAPEQEYLVVNGRNIAVDKELKEHLRAGPLVSAEALVKGSALEQGSVYITMDDLIAEEGALEARQGGIAYDEWDYHRGDYKKAWCTLYEQEVHPGHEPFVELTLKRYSGHVKVLRKKFELLKKEHRILRLQKDGEDIDFDAAVEAYADLRAGQAPGENLFTRIDRQERSIAVLFLVDMSGSTKGWVSEAEKEALVLMCEALEALGDRYAIYGFSGMTRSRCDYYRIKAFAEDYADTVKKRIAGIAPKDYTRMGPPLRHSIHLLKSVEARTKLLITLSDGKPEDWDAYKGDYGVEDTRRALIEAKEQGIHSFCITIDKEGPSYLPRMYGEARYIVIDSVRTLPNKITEIYRHVTT